MFETAPQPTTVPPTLAAEALQSPPAAQTGPGQGTTATQEPAARPVQAVAKPEAKPDAEPGPTPEQAYIDARKALAADLAAFGRAESAYHDAGRVVDRSRRALAEADARLNDAHRA